MCSLALKYFVYCSIIFIHSIDQSRPVLKHPLFTQRTLRLRSSVTTPLGIAEPLPGDSLLKKIEGCIEVPRKLSESIPVFPNNPIAVQHFQQYHKRNLEHLARSSVSKGKRGLEVLAKNNDFPKSSNASSRETSG